ncbi:hypothetical protein K501DRAFT_267823 [Backusella circina FSU 941]|nr:hypothetical protein K501DRAFT_267823 [Backusella circina FSU 941]
MIRKNIAIGFLEAQNLGLATDVIKQGSRWKEYLTHLENHYEMEKPDDDKDDKENENDDTERRINDLCMKVQFIQENGQNQLSTEKTTKKTSSEQDIAKMGFLNLLLRCRRIIIQDTAVLLFEGRADRIIIKGKE